MFIQTEQTPNPVTLKFLPGREVMGAGTADFPTPESATRSPLAQRLFAIQGIAGVFLGADYREWHLLKPAILGVIMEHFTAGRPVVTQAAEAVVFQFRFGQIDAAFALAAEFEDQRLFVVEAAMAGDGGEFGVFAR